MPRIPKKVLDRWNKTVPKFQKILQVCRDRDVNESDTVEIITDMLDEVFGYDKYLEVTSEFAIRGRYCDVAMKVDGKVQFLMEAKAIGIDPKEKHLRQAVDYGANHGMQWIILCNGGEWKLYRIRFEQPINYDFVAGFDFMKMNPRNPQDQELLFLLSREGLDKDVREEFFEKSQSVNRYVMGRFLMSEPVVKVLRRELKKFADGVKIETEEIEKILKNEVLKRDLIEGDEADDAKKRVNKFSRKKGQ